MTNSKVSIKDPDLAKVGIALERAAAKAKQLGLDTNTPVYVFRSGKIIDIVAEHRTTRLPEKPRINGAPTRKLQKKRSPSSKKKLNNEKDKQTPIA